MKNSKTLQGKVALVTGAGQGIGLATAVRLGQEGAKVAVNGRMAHPKIQAAAEAAGGIPVIADISQPSEIRRMVTEIEEKLGPVEILVANAARMAMLPFLEEDPEVWWQQLNINLTGHIDCIHAVLPGMKRLGRGKIIIISSMFGVVGWKNATGYAASKSGLTALGEALAAELGPQGIDVSIVVPGVIDTPQLQVDADDLDMPLEDVHEMYAKGIPMGRIGTAEEVAATAAYLAGTGGAHLAGRILQINGGESRCCP